MKAIHIPKPGGPEVLTVTERKKPQPGPNEVLVRIEAAGVNRPDVLQRKGNYPAPKNAPADIPGLEIAGTIVELGSNVKSMHIGDPICALISGGGYAEYAIAPAPQCLPIPRGIDWVEAASLPETFFTVWQNIFDIARFKKGEQVLIHGGSSGIGVAAIQMIKALGGKVYVTAGSDTKCRVCEELGADKAINYNEDDFVAQIQELSSGTGVDIVLDMVGGDYADKNIRILRERGRLVMINAMAGKMASVNLIQIMAKQLVVTGSTLRPRSVEHKGEIAKNLLENIWPLIPNPIKPVVFKTFPLAAAESAHRLMESSA